MGKPVWLYGVAFHTHIPRTEEADGSVILGPGVYSVDQAGYDHSELCIPSLKHFCDFVRKHRPNLVEFESPGPVETLILFACLVLGIKTCSHYRTDINSYAELLVKNAPGVWGIQTWTKIFTLIAGPVIVPSEAYRDKVAAMGVAPRRIFKLARGVDHSAFSPELRGKGVWEAQGLPHDGLRLLYVGRVSAEKNLPLLTEVFAQLSPRYPEISLTVVGDGPYRKEMETRLAECGRVFFTGVQSGSTLSGIFADADLFVFPSLTDTFGNSVVEALASGLPCIVSDQGGPCEIVIKGECGFVFTCQPNGQKDNELQKVIESAIAETARLSTMRYAARERALRFTFAASAEEFWNFYSNFHQKPL